MDKFGQKSDFLNKVCQRFLFVPVIVIVVSVLVIVFNWHDRVVVGIETEDASLNEQVLDANIKEDIREESKNKVDAPSNVSKMTKDDAKLDINSATVEKLMRLPGIGAAKAAAIVEVREKMGGFRTLQDIACAEGIGTKVFEKIKPFIEINTQYKK
jgi:competence protein ComEA